MHLRKCGGVSSNHKENRKDFLDRQERGNHSPMNIGNVAGSTSKTASVTLKSVLDLSRTKEKELLRKFGIVQSTSTSAKQQVETKTIKKRKKRSSNSSKKAEQAKKLRTVKKTYKVKRLPTEKNPKNSATFIVKKPACRHKHRVDSKETLLISDSILDFEDYDANIEHDSIVTKYGLPYDIIQCACSLKEEIFGFEEKLKYNSNPVCLSQSCYDFEKLYGRSNQASKYSRDGRKSEYFRKACETYDSVMKKARETMDQEEFTSAVCFMKVHYPHYWKNVSRRETLYLNDYERTKEKFSKTQVTLSCMRLLKEQDLLSRHYRVRMNGIRDGVGFNDRLNHNFTVACNFLKKEYPNLFVYLIKRYDFKELVCKKLEIIRNRLRLIKRARLPNEKLKRLDDKYRRSYRKH